ENFVSENINDICASYQHHLIKVLLKNVIKVLKDTGITGLAIAGGVSANTELREQVKNLETKFDIKTFIPPFEYCTDNAAMIGITGYYKYLKKEFSGLDVIPVTRMRI
ncbi:MAG: putative glycoprotease, partial [Bacteroidetes bacterium]|nr:putative glycoprotease [Bacteroidota bacterium]